MATDPREVQIYLLPNLMTAGNLFCGFLAVLQVFQGMLAPEGGVEHYYYAIALILGACIFDALDGRLARIGGKESAFGREFDSLADIISFGIAPALLVYQIVLADFPDRIGYMIAFVYLLCGAMRLARFNCVAAEDDGVVRKDFSGFPIPAAAGVIASITLFLLWWQGEERIMGPWRYALPPLMLMLAYLMFSHIRYPSFKAINLRTRRSPAYVFIAIVALVATVLFWQWMPAVLFVSYLCYGLVRPWVSRRWRREIEQETGENGDDPDEDLEDLDDPVAMTGHDGGVDEKDEGDETGRAPVVR